MSAKILFWRAFKILLILAASGFVALGILFCALWLEHKRGVTLPMPTGHYAVGRTTFELTNNSHDKLSPPWELTQHLPVWIWYPASPAASAASADYAPAPWREAFARFQGRLPTEFLTQDLKLVTSHSTVDPPVSEEQRTYPVVIMRTGLSAPTIDYTTLAEDLASHGYIVVGFDAPYRTFAVALRDGRVITRSPANNPEGVSDEEVQRIAGKLVTAWVADARFVLDQVELLNKADPTGKFTDRLDLDSVGAFGHSLGGSTASQFCHDDPRCKAAIDIDGAPFGSVIQDGLGQSFMFLLSDHSRDNDPNNNLIARNIQSIYEKLPPDTRLEVTIRGSNHFSFTDQSLLKSQLVLNALRRLHILGPVDGRLGLAITTDWVHTFFDVHLKNAPQNQLTDLEKRYPEVQLLRP